MDEEAPNYRREFFKSSHHAWLGMLTLGLGFLSAQPFYFLLGVTAYTLGWIYLPDMPFFQRSVDRRREGEKNQQMTQQLAAFAQKRDAVLNALSLHRRQRYLTLAQVCTDIEDASKDNAFSSSNNSSFDARLRRLDELMWTFLRLLSIEESLERLLDTERREDLPSLIKEDEAAVGRISQEIDALKKQDSNSLLQTKERLRNSRLEELDVLRKRVAKIEQAEANLAVIRSEQDRLDHQIKLIRADAVADKNTESLTSRIDSTVEHLNETNKWLAEIDQFKDMVGDLPNTEQRLGYLSNTPPVISSEVRQPARTRSRQ
jgi:hypothetical protein